jgi:hypothetical protein
MTATKPWWTSKTVWAGVGTMAAAVGSAAYAYFVQHDTPQALIELGGLLSTGGFSIYGRMTATQRIGPEGQSQPQI